MQIQSRVLNILVPWKPRLEQFRYLFEPGKSENRNSVESFNVVSGRQYNSLNKLVLLYYLRRYIHHTSQHHLSLKIVYSNLFALKQPFENVFNGSYYAMLILSTKNTVCK